MNRKKYEIYESKEYNNIREVLDNAFTNYPDNVAFKLKETNGKQVTYKEIKYKNFQNDINALGTALINLGLKDKRVAIISKNRYEWILSYVSILNGTGIAVPLDKGLPEEETESSLQRSYAEAVIFANDYMDTMKKFKASGATDVTKFICMDQISDEEKKAGFLYLGDLIEEGKKLVENGNREFIDAKIDDNKMSIILFTSGTTSKSKAVMLSHRNIASNICHSTIHLEVQEF